MSPSSRRRTLARVVAAAVVPVAFAVSALARQTPSGRPLVPVAASTFARSPDAFIGESVSLAGAVDTVVSTIAFTVDQDAAGSVGPAVLVVAEGLSGAVRASRRVTVIGDVVRLGRDVLASRLADRAAEVPADVVAHFTGRPVVFATTVLQDGADLTRRLPPPLAPGEAAYAEVMRRIGPAFSEIRKSMESTSPGNPRPATAALRQAFGDTERFWRARHATDAADWAAEARTQVGVIEKAAAGARWDDAKTAVAALGKTCQSCHEAYRERFDDGSYRIRRARK